ncbi:MAG: serine/threonine-protein phosphatase [Candidatus Eremiobacteraeota bacterium]|nr:serine/threonine-protein phosphatase [Candidatus Eremiobacteraeota bacterium]
MKFYESSSTESGKVVNFSHDASAFENIKNKKDKQLLMAVVADGSQSFADGEHPAEIAVSIVENFFSTKIFKKIRSKRDYPRVERGISDIINLINTTIYTRAQEEGIRGSVSMSAVFVVEETMFIAHVGSGRTLRIRKDEITQLTKGQSWFSMAMKERGMTVAEALSSSGTAETKLLGEEPTIQFNIKTDNLKPDDVVVLCTDGISEFIPNQEIKVIIDSTDNLDTACNRLTTISKDRGLKDHSTIIIIRYFEEQKAHKKSVDEIVKKEEEKKGGCGTIYYFLLFFLLFIICTALYLGYRSAEKIKYHVLKPTKTITTREPVIIESKIPTATTYMELEENGMPLSIFRMNKLKLDPVKLHYEIINEHNEVEVLPKFYKGTFNLTITTNPKESYKIIDDSNRNTIRIYENNIKIYTTRGCVVSFFPEVKGGVSKIQLSELGSPVSIHFGKESFRMKLDKDPQ